MVLLDLAENRRRSGPGRVKFSNDLGTWPVLAVLFVIAVAILVLLIGLLAVAR